jgi:hypothetical protein
MQNLDEANRMLDVFASVGAMHFDVTFLGIDREKRGFRKEQSVLQLKNSLPKLLPGLTERQNNLIIRPHAKEGVALIQLDDLDAAALERVKDVAFLTLATSPGNHQAWVAVTGVDSPKDFVRRIRKGTGADAAASGAVRLSGTVNYKVKYAPTFPTVSIVSAAPGCIVTPEQLEQAALLAPAEVLARNTHVLRNPAGERRWPDYERCLAGAPQNAEGTGPDRSKADYTFCKFAAQRGFTVEEIVAELPLVSEKARERIRLRDPGYVTVTAENGAAAGARTGQPRGR